MVFPILTFDACSPALSWQQAVEALRRGHGLPRPEQGDLLLGPDSDRLLTRAAWIQGLGAAVKAETVIAGNASRGLPSVQGAVLLFDPDGGAVRAAIESRLITQWKTVADSLLGAQCLARSESRSLVVVGAGAVAETLARGYAAIFPGLRQIALWSRRLQQAAALAATLSGLRVEVAAVTDLPAAVGAADIVSSATMARAPVIHGDWVRPGTHVDLVGAYTPEMREADDALIARGRVYVDFMATVMDRIGEVMEPIRTGAIARDHIRGDLYDLVALRGAARQSKDEITVFKNGGGAHLDLMMACYIADAVEAAG